MNQFWRELRFAGIMGLLVPGIVLGVAVSFHDDDVEAVPAETIVTEPTEEPVRSELRITVLTNDASVREMELSDYLTGVVLAEMPASFEAEALKAQGVVARTYTIRASEKSAKHKNAAVCTNSACCQGYISEPEYLDQGGRAEDVEKIRSAVMDTEYEVLTYEGELIEATYFSCSGGSTEDAVAVWGTDVPYLQAVESPGEEYATHYSDAAQYSAEDFAAALSLPLTGNPADWFGAVTYTEGGGVDTMVIGGVTFKGTTLRSALGLHSTAFAISTAGDTITISTKGYGHRVGMSQYGADAMAAAGSTYKEILAHYYQGTTLENWRN